MGCISTSRENLPSSDNINRTSTTKSVPIAPNYTIQPQSILLRQHDELLTMYSSAFIYPPPNDRPLRGDLNLRHQRRSLNLE